MRTHQAPIFILALLFAAALSLPTGCGGDAAGPGTGDTAGGEDDTASDDDASSEEDGASSTTSDVADDPTDDSGPAEVDDDTSDEPAGVMCTPEEATLVAETNLDMILGNCAETCMHPDNTESEVKSCATECVAESSSISESCSSCFGEFLLCTLVECSTVSEDPDADAPPCPGNPEACGVCVQTGCEPQLAACVGSPGGSVPTEGNCTNDDDMGVIATSLDTMFETCGDACLDGTNVGACLEGCTKDIGIGDLCGECFYALGDCVGSSCGDVCTAETANDAACQLCIQSSCGDDFLGCSGVALFSDEPECSDPQDMALLQGPVDLTDVCSGECMSGDDNVEACMTSCLSDAGLTDECSMCIGGFTLCVATDCSDDCTGNAGSDEACGICIDEKCGDKMVACVGMGTGPGPGPGPGPGDIMCGGEADQAVLQDNEDLNQDCALSCATAGANTGTCITDCLQAAGLSTTCSGCVTAVIGCGFDHCADVCIDPSQQVACDACFAANCADEAAACFGDEGDVPNPPGPDDEAVCFNPEDRALFDASPPPEDGCAMECWLVPTAEKKQCIADCLVMAGISEPCGDCMADMMICIFDSCEVCTSLNEADAEACNACITAECADEAETCWGGP